MENDDGKEMSWTLQKEEEASSSGSSCSSSRDGWQEEKISSLVTENHNHSSFTNVHPNNVAIYCVKYKFAPR